MNKLNYPTCIRSFKNFLKSDSKYLNIYNEILKKPQVFDVSLRDGLQTVGKLDIDKYCLERKKEIYYNILETHHPKHMEIGSYVSPKVMPIFIDTPELFKYLELYDSQLGNGLKPDLYLFVPTLEKLVELENKHNDIFLFCKNFSLTTSCSFGFQMKNINKTLNETKEDLKLIIKYLQNKKGTNNFKIKLYISCINECPVNGKLDIDYIVDEIMYYYMNYKIDNICLSDTMGTLEPNDFEKIIDKCIFWGMNNSFLSLHLHYKEKNTDDERRIEEIITKALTRKINKFDVSEMRMGGCPITLDKEKIKNNLTYELFYKCLVDHIINLSKNTY